MSLLITNASGLAANTNGEAVPVYNRDPVFSGKTTTVYVWAGTWAGVVVQLLVSPLVLNSQLQPIWFPIPAGTAVSENGFFSFPDHWGMIKAEVSGATADTLGLYCAIINPLS